MEWDGPATRVQTVLRGDGETEPLQLLVRDLSDRLVFTFVEVVRCVDGRKENYRRRVGCGGQIGTAWKAFY